MLRLQVQDEGDSGNVDLAGPNSTDPTLNALDLDNIVFYVNIDGAHFYHMRKSLMVMKMEKMTMTL